jgi:histidine kinase/DNA gyrase B/HSP90-like ATPase
MLARLDSDPGLLHSFAKLRSTVSEQSKVIIHVFPEYTPHDATRHLEQLFALADRVLGTGLYDRLNVAEMSLLVFALYAHDWGMAVSNNDRDAISGVTAAHDVVLIPDEVSTFQQLRDEAVRLGKTDAQVWEDYLRQTHARRSGFRLRKELRPLGHSFAEMVARVAEGHVLDIRELRDPEQYPLHTALFGKIANVAAVATLVRLVDLLDLAEDRTPLALWSIVRPRNEISRTEWSKHRALAPIAVSEHEGIRQVLITGTTDDPDVFAALADLKSWVDAQFAESVAFLRDMGNQYDPKLDSAIRWDIEPVGFEPVLLRFEFDRPAALGLLSAEIYGGQKLTFVRELLQNSVDAIDTRVELLRQTDTPLQGRISINIITLVDAIRIEWTDNGVGMDRNILESYLTKIGRSWYQSPDFRRHSFAHDPVSKFGIGLLSCFAVSTSLTVITKREPLLARDTLGWHLRIPTLDGYFRVKEAKHAHVGTTIILEFAKPSADIKATTIATKIKQIASLVKYSIALQVDGFTEVLEPITDFDDPRLPFIRVGSLDETALASLQTSTVKLNHRYLSPDRGYEAFFSCLLPYDLSSITSLEYRTWRLASKTFDFDDFIIETPRKLFLKGIASDIEREGTPRGDFDSIALNVLKPSLVRPDLSRAHIDVRSLNLDEAWKEVAAGIGELFGHHFTSIDERVKVLSVASRLAGLPDEALTHLVPHNDWPIWTLECGSGLIWREASDVLRSEVVLEAPDELSYVLGNEGYFKEASRSFEHWIGPACFVALNRYSSWPWWGRTSTLAYVVLEKQGFVPADLCLVNSPADDQVPLVCRVWRKQSNHARPSQNLGLPDLLAEWRKNPMLECPQLVEQALHSGMRSSGNTPLLVRFPDGMDQLAAIGSLYWNQNNTKIRALVDLLLELSVRSRSACLSGRTEKVFQYVNDTSYLGYTIHTRHSGSRAAIEDIAR